MTLRRKMGLQIAAMIVGLLLVSGASLWGLNGLQEDYGDALRGYAELRRVFEAGAELTTARALLAAPEPDRDEVVRRVRRALTSVEGDGGGTPDKAVPRPGTRWDSANAALATGLRDTLGEMRGWQRTGGPPPTAAVSRVLKQISDTASEVRAEIEASRAAAQAKRRATLLALAVLCAAVVVAAVLLGGWQYRGVIGPLHRLGEAVRRVAAGHFAERIPAPAAANGSAGSAPADPDEFAALARDFNRMAAELDGLYRDLEQKVAAKSKELIRSERLASVGYLAAGVAHEINNPLGIIAGYAEHALAEMRGGRSAPPADVDATLRVIRDEAFRCKDITGKLLSLARPGDGQRQPLDLARVAEDVVSVLGGLPHFKDRTITVRADGRGSLVVEAVEGEMKQVLMNLLLNALEATSAGGKGEVRVTLARDADRDAVTLAVADNGRGMTAETQERVFEPFFTERLRRGPDAPQPRPGTGLGLAITHAIVQSHAGRISAQSDGPGRGSRFVVELPAARAARPVATAASGSAAGGPA